MHYKVSTQLHTANPKWFPSLINFAEKHLKTEVRPAVKAKAMPLITKICLANRDIYEEDLIMSVILPHMKNLENESDPTVRVSGVHFLVDFLMESSSKKGHDLLHILDKVRIFYHGLTINVTKYITFTVIWCFALNYRLLTDPMKFTHKPDRTQFTFTLKRKLMMLNALLKGL